MRNQLKNHLQRREGFGSPVDGNERKESMFDLVPFAGGRRIMNYGDRELLFIGEVLELFLPEAISRPIGATPISRDQQLLCAWIECFARLLPPPPDAFHRELSSIVIDTYVDKATLVDQIIHAIGHGFTVSQRKKIVDIHAGLLSFRLPFCAIVFEIAEQLFFLTIHRNDRITSLLKLLTCAVNLFKLGISIGMRGSFDRF